MEAENTTGLCGCSCRPGTHHGRHWHDLGRARLSLQPSHVGPVVGPARSCPVMGRGPQPARSGNAPYYWPYARYGINFHPPLAGQLNLATHALFGSWMKDIPARRMASVIEFALTI